MNMKFGTKQFYLEQKALLKKYKVSNSDIKDCFEVIKKYPGVNFQEKEIYVWANYDNGEYELESSLEMPNWLSEWQVKKEVNLVLYYWSTSLHKNNPAYKAYLSPYWSFVNNLKYEYFNSSILQKGETGAVTCEKIFEIIHLIDEMYFVVSTEKFVKPKVYDLMNLPGFSESAQIHILSVKLKDEELDRAVFGEFSFYGK